MEPHSKARLASERIRSLLSPASLDSQGAVDIAATTIEDLLVDASLDIGEFFRIVDQVPYLLEFVLAGKHAGSVFSLIFSNHHTMDQLQRSMDSQSS